MEEADDHAFSRMLAEDAGRLLLDLRDRLVAEGATSAELKAEGDRQAHELLMSRLADERPGDAVLSEEGAGAEGPAGTTRLSAERTWIVDPLDGTREYSE